MKPDTPDSIFVFPDFVPIGEPNGKFFQPDLTICTDLEFPDFQLFQEIYHPSDDEIPY